MTQNDIEKKLNSIEKSIDKMSANYDRTLNEIMVEQEKQKGLKSANDSLQSVFDRQETSKNYDLYRFFARLFTVGLVIGILLGVVTEVLKTFIPVV